MSSSLQEQIAAMCEESDSWDYQATGFHQGYRAKPSALREIAEVFLAAGYILEMLTCLDKRESDQVMCLCYTFNCLEAVDRHIVHVDLSANIDANINADLNASIDAIPSLCAIFGGANWLEREVYDMYGVTFTEHPDLERILLPDDTDFFPLRKDFGRIEDADSNEASND